MILRLPYGKTAMTVDLRGVRCHALLPEAPRAATSSGHLVGRALDAPLEVAPLRELARGRHSVVILVPDHTRRVPLPEVLAPLFERLHAAGVESSAVTVLVAAGTHPPMAPERLADLVGTVPEGVRVEQHDARDQEHLVEVGTTSDGARVRLNRRAAEADLLIAVSTVQHHYFAGFGGGPKMVFPGVAGYEEIQANHARVIDLSGASARRDPGCEPGVLTGNPVAEGIVQAARLRPPDLAVEIVNNGDGIPCWVAAGSLEAAFAAACERVRAWFEVVAGPFRRVVVSSGGHPVDATLIQAHKALDAACRFAEEGGEVLFVAACGEGAGSPDMEPFLDDPRPEAILARLCERYVQYGHTTLRLVEKARRFRISVATELDEALTERLGLRRERPEDVVERWRAAPEGAVAVMAGAAVYPARSGSGS